jgi:hypothetical protein
LAFLKLHCGSPLLRWTDDAAHAGARKRPRGHERGHERGDEKARGGFARASDAVLINKEFVQDSVTSSQAFCLLGSRKSAVPVNNRRKTEIKARMYTG